MRSTSLVVSLLSLLLGCGSTSPMSPTSMTPSNTRIAPIPSDPNAIPGLDAVVIELHADKTHCGGQAITMKRIAGKPVPAGDDVIVAVFELQFPTGLDFTEGPAKIATVERFQAWVADMQQRGGAATKHYTELATSGNPAIKAAALARMVQAYLHLAALLDHAEIPVSIRRGEFADDAKAAYCDKLGEVADPIKKKADEARNVCRDQAKRASGWWNVVCS